MHGTWVLWVRSGGSRGTLVGESMMQVIIQNRGRFQWEVSTGVVGFLWSGSPGGPAVRNSIREISPIQYRKVEAPMIINFESSNARGSVRSQVIPWDAHLLTRPDLPKVLRWVGHLVRCICRDLAVTFGTFPQTILYETIQNTVIVGTFHVVRTTG